MKPANDPLFDYKCLVRQAYDRCGINYDVSRPRVAPAELNMLTRRLTKGSSILDIGCGAGIPVASSLSGSFAVTGVDISETMIKQACLNVPGAKFIQGDIMSAVFSASSFDAAVAFYAIFHIPREEHSALFSKIHKWLKPSGYFFATLSFNDDASYTDEYMGGTMYWSNYGLEEYYKLLSASGFKTIKTTAIGGGYLDINFSPKERHPLILAQKV